MRVFDQRYVRDARRYELALRMIQHEVRTRTIRAWTALSAERIRTLFRSYHGDSGGAKRRRGPVPHSLESILQSPRLRSEAAAIVGVCYALEVLPNATASSRSTPSLSWGERLCDAFELYAAMVQGSPLSLEQVILLVTQVARRSEVALARCTVCEAVILIHRFARQRHVCAYCRREAGRDQLPTSSKSGPTPKTGREGEQVLQCYQGSLF